MQDKPDLQDEKIIACLRDSYGITITDLEFLPIGADGNAGVYRASTDDGKTYFLKVKRGAIGEPGVLIPRYLYQNGVEQVIAPIPTGGGALWDHIEDFTILLYPFVDGDNGMNVPLSDGQWITLGRALKKIHTLALPSEITALVEREAFAPDARKYVRGLLEMVRGGQYDDPHQRDMAAIWKEKRDEIVRLVVMAEKLANALQTRPLDTVLCHSDIHTANVLLGAGDAVFIVDWDQPILAPKERDLMFVGGGVMPVRENEVEYFYKGYGAVEIDYLALAYYRYERIVQDFMEYGKDIFSRTHLSTEAKDFAVDVTRYQFEPGSVIDIAQQTEAHLPPELRFKT